MPIIKTDKESIIKESVALFKIHGYHNTTMANIGEACGLIKGSMYHYFKSKEQIGLESLKYIHEYFNQHIFSIAYQTNLSDREKMIQFVKKNDEYCYRNYYKKIKKWNSHIINKMDIYYNRNAKDFGETPISVEKFILS